MTNTKKGIGLTSPPSRLTPYRNAAKKTLLPSLFFRYTRFIEKPLDLKGKEMNIEEIRKALYSEMAGGRLEGLYANRRTGLTAENSLTPILAVGYEGFGAGQAMIFIHEGKIIMPYFEYGSLKVRRLVEMADVEFPDLDFIAKDEENFVTDEIETLIVELKEIYLG